MAFKMTNPFKQNQVWKPTNPPTESQEAKDIKEKYGLCSVCGGGKEEYQHKGIEGGHDFSSPKKEETKE